MIACWVTMIVCTCCRSGVCADAATTAGNRLQAAAVRFGITPDKVIKTNTAKLPKEAEIAGPLKTTVTLLDDGQTRVCVICCDWVKIPRNVTQMFRRAIAIELKIREEQVIFFASHNHSDTSLIMNEMGGFEWGLPPYQGPTAQLNEIGNELLARLISSVRELESQLQPVSIWWAVGNEDRITYNRKGRRADGSTFMMREEDRVLQGVDFRGDIDTQAPVVVFKNEAGQPVVAWVQFAGHPVTSFSPEIPVVFGDYPQVACDVLGKKLGGESEVPVAFFQGCAGDVNSKEMFRGGVKRAIEFGEMLGQSYVDALPKLQKSERNDLAFAATVAELPLGPLPTEAELQRDLDEIEAFIRRARNGDEETLHCVGLNFPRDLSPAYRAGLVDRVRMWTAWALELRQAGGETELPKVLPVELWVFRVGDVGFVGMPLEPFLGIGRKLRRNSPLPLTVPCGYANFTMGYIPDGPNIGDREYMSSFHRYTAAEDKNIRPRPPLDLPGGDVIADEGVRVLTQMAGESTR
ncbi:hypothetical protein M4951_16225 [Blastopirellula sp. J2-11]|uniref:hypothetical protein n=1 Tax=Blastopirellula sp. J2-11 TaxID=2943192 RepID=UPI0021C823F7|nr:hypothetical protein [Blastopirellula sp. J2-11]UUO04927.1 hypothetical protein M4951_16225 [Blastopirellula sp. J2-11]